MKILFKIKLWFWWNFLLNQTERLTLRTNIREATKKRAEEMIDNILNYKNPN